jgi:hypothetical protein
MADPARQPPVWILTGMLCALLVIPLFFSIQILLIEIGRPDLTLNADRAVRLYELTPNWSRIAPILRIGVLLAGLVFLWRKPDWFLPAFILDVMLHVSGWILIIGNPEFTLPTGYISFGLQAVTGWILLQFGPLPGR